MSSPEITSSYLARHEHLRDQLAAAGFELLALNPGPSLIYLTGLNFHLMERPVVVLFSTRRPPVIVLPELEIAKLGSLPFDHQAFTYNDNPQSWQSAYDQAAEVLGMDALPQVGAEPTHLRLLELGYLQQAAPHTRFISAQSVLAALRLRKDAAELACMRKAVDIAQRALLATLPAIRTGMAERELASELTLQLLRAGSDPEIPFAPIVSSGPNSANPHASPSERLLQAGDLLVIDWGAAYQGYFSDLTRTIAIGHTVPELEHIHKLVQQANLAGRLAGKPGMPAGAVDAAARAVIEQAGYSQYFIHRTGHGLGMEAHEEPYIFAGNSFILEPGMTYTVEPGIYLPGRNGVRIEDNVVVTEHSSESLSDLPRELQVFG